MHSPVCSGKRGVTPSEVGARGAFQRLLPHSALCTSVWSRSISRNPNCVVPMALGAL